MNERQISAVWEALEILRYVIEPTITTIYLGGDRRAAIVLPGTWEELGYCDQCGKELKWCECSTEDMT